MTDSEKLAVVYDSVVKIEKALYGNGQPGITQRVEDLESWRKWVMGIAVGVGVAMGAWGHAFFQALTK